MKNNFVFMEVAKVKSLCGPYPENFIKPEIKSDPNFVFINDPEFKKVTLYDQEGNSATVNSFVECQHYVEGGWDYNPLISNEYIYFNIIGIITIITSFFFIYLLRKVTK